jgi:hypothetical protein
MAGTAAPRLDVRSLLDTSRPVILAALGTVVVAAATVLFLRIRRARRWRAEFMRATGFDPLAGQPGYVKAWVYLGLTRVAAGSSTVEVPVNEDE